MPLNVLALVGAALLIYFSCKLFVNGIEWVGRKFDVAENAVGTVLAAFGTALPESAVTFIAVVFGVSASQKDIGVGAALGGPLILGTIAYAVVGWSIGATEAGNTGRPKIDGAKLGRDQLWFLAIFAFTALLGSLVFPGKAYAALPLVAVYGLYCWREMQVAPPTGPAPLQPLTFRPRAANPTTAWVLFQTLLSLVLIFAGSRLFVANIEALSASFGAPAHIVALLLSPVATELPETLNAVIWVRQGKTALALSNISGSMMIQATIPSALGIFFTPWQFDQYLYVAAGTTMLSVVFLWLTLKNGRFSAGRLSFAALFYVVFALVAYCLYRLPPVSA